MDGVATTGILVLDFGSQYTLLIARALRELGFYTEVMPWDTAHLPKWKIAGVVLSGGPASVGTVDAPTLPAWVLERNVPVLGICYGMQLLVAALGGKVRSGTLREYGAARVTFAAQTPNGRELLHGLPNEQQVWMSHGDDAEALSGTFLVLGTSSHGAVAAIEHTQRPIFGLQFHPEVKHSTCGKDLLRNFAQRLCHLPAEWSAAAMLTQTLAATKAQVESGRVLLGVSGGVDSTVAAYVLRQALGKDQVKCVLIDHGLLRKNEAAEVQATFASLDIDLDVCRHAELFLTRLAGVSDPEAKRKIIGNAFIECFEMYAKTHGPFTHLGQGTLYPDVIESAGHGTGARVIKSHHNVGGLPERMALRLVEPFRFLFKDEVRALGRTMGIPESVLLRHPFPGPSLGVRIPGAVDAAKVALLQEADAIFISALKEQGFYQRVWQAGAILLPVKSVGVMGDQRTYEWTCVLRAVTAEDAMTADVAELPMSFLTSVARRIVNSVKGINRVLYDVTTKPPATIEWE